MLPHVAFHREEEINRSWFVLEDPFFLIAKVRRRDWSGR